MNDAMQLNPEEMRIWETIIEVNRLWTERNEPQALHRWFHPRMIAACAGETDFRVGQEMCVDGWKGFREMVSDLSFKESAPVVRIYCDGRTAVVAYKFNCAFTMNGVRTELLGRDLFTLVNEDGRWQVVADHFSSNE